MAWGKGAALNILAPSFIIDQRLRALPHPSFYDYERNLEKWLKDIFNKVDFKKFKVFLLLVQYFLFYFYFYFFMEVTCS